MVGVGGGYLGEGGFFNGQYISGGATCQTEFLRLDRRYFDDVK